MVKLADENDLLVECDVASDASIQAAFETIKMSGHNRWTSPCDCFCQKEELSGNVSDITRDGFLLAQDISSYSL